ncbi:MAG: BatD family protein [Bacteroidota bacterium]|nr:BatD family protein [Bacteroidota bacterium]
MKRILTLICLLVINFSFSQIKFEAEVSKNNLGVNENLRVDFKMNKDGDNFNPPSFDGFSVVGGPNQSVSNSWINGVRSFSKTYSYFLSPLKKGKYTIGQASIEIDGDIYKTMPIQVKVTEAVQSSVSPNNPVSFLNDDIELNIEVSKSETYLNEPISVEFKLIFNPKINVTNLGEIDSPEFNNFWSQNIKIPRLEIKSTSYKGQRYNYVTWKRTLLFPQKSGNLELLPLTLDVTVDVPTNRRDFFGNVIYTQTSKKVSSKKKNIKVKEFPSDGKPESFNGAVGKFDVSLFSSKTELKATESFQLELKVNGRGNLKLFTLPEIKVPSSLEKYDPEFKEDIKSSMSGMNGQISNTYTIVPQFQGKYPIPAVEFSYFDPEVKKYVTIKTNESIVDVTEGPMNSEYTNNSGLSFNQNNTIQTTGQFNYIKLSSKFSSINSKKLLDSKLWLYTLLSIPFLIFIVILLLIKVIRKSISDSDLITKNAEKLARKYLENAKIDISNKESFYSSLDQALFNFFKSKYMIRKEDFSKDKIKSILIKENISEKVINDVIELIQSCEIARYTPATTDAMDKDYEKAVQILTNFENV